MKYWSLLLVVVMATNGSYAVEIDSSSETIVSLEQVTGLARAVQNQFWQLIPPMDDPLYIHPDRIVRAVDWKSKEWPNVLRKQMVAEMETVNSSMYPFYRMFVVETRIGERVYYNVSDQEIWRTPAPFGYNPYLFAFQLYGVDSIEELTAQQLEFGRSSNIGFEILLLPEVFMNSYVVDAAMEKQAALLAAPVAVPLDEDGTVSVGISLVPMETLSASLDESEEIMMAMTSSSPPPPPTGGGGTNSVPGGGSSNLLVELTIHLPEGFGYLGHIELFTKDDLIYSTSWELADSWVPSHGSQTVKWIDPASSNKMERFYYINDGADSDGDGYSDLREAWVEGTDSNPFNTVNTDGDYLNDWLEYKLFCDLSQTGSSDFDGDQIPNNEELVFDAAGRPIALLTDPTLFSSDGDVLGDGEQFNSPPTDPWNPDADKPSASISWPTNNTVVIF